MTARPARNCQGRLQVEMKGHARQYLKAYGEITASIKGNNEQL